MSSDQHIADGQAGAGLGLEKLGGGPRPIPSPRTAIETYLGGVEDRLYGIEDVVVSIAERLGLMPGEFDPEHYAAEIEEHTHDSAQDLLDAYREERLSRRAFQIIAVTRYFEENDLYQAWREVVEGEDSRPSAGPGHRTPRDLSDESDRPDLAIAADEQGDIAGEQESYNEP